MTPPPLNPQLHTLYLFGKLGTPLPPELQEFFSENPAPWDCLGSRLVDFLRKTIEIWIQDGRSAGRLPATVYHSDEGGPVFIEDGAHIEPGVFLRGPCIIKAGAEIRHGAYVRGGVYVSSGAVVGHTTEVKGSIFCPGAKASHFAYVGDSILGVDCNLGAGTKLANLRFDNKKVMVRWQGGEWDTGLRKLGALVADGAQTGCNSVTNPGTILLPRAAVPPCTSVTGVVGRGRP